MIKNILQSAEIIRNDHSCVYDTNYGYDCVFTKNGNVEGWDVYDNVYLYGCWDKTLFGTSSTTTCYIGRTDNIYPVVAEEFPIFRMMLKITAPTNPYKSPPTTGRIQWKTSSDDSWDTDKSEIFTIESTDSWFLCELELNDHQYWSSSITSLRITLFEGGYEGISFAIRYIRLASTVNFTCLNKQCSYYTKYSHPCVGDAAFSTITAGVGHQYYTTLSGISDSLIVNIDNYGEEKINLGTNEHMSGVDMAKLITTHLNRVDIGSYAYATVEHTEENKLKITSGNLPTSTDLISTDIDAELILYVYAYSMSSEFMAALSTAGWIYTHPVTYLYVLYGDIIPFLEIVYGDFLTSNLSYYTVANSLSTTLTNSGYFIDILEIKASKPLNILSICCDVYASGNIMVNYSSLADVSVVAACAQTSFTFSILDVTNNTLLINNYSTPKVTTSTYTTSSRLKITTSDRVVVNLILVNPSVGITATTTININYGSRIQAYAVDQLSSTWLSDTFGATPDTSSFGETIEITGGTAAEMLGFYTDGIPTYTTTDNNIPPTGFEFASSKRLRYFEIAKLIDNDFKTLGYLHKPNQPAVDAGRRSYFESLAANTVSISSSADYYKKLDGADKIIIDFTHPISDCGRLNNIKIGGSVSSGLVGEVLIFRRYKDGNLICIGSMALVSEHDDYVYSKNVTTNYLSLNIFVSKGDLIGFKNIDLLCLHSCKTRSPNASLCVIPASTDVSIPFSPGELFSQGIIGPSYYAYSDRLQDSLKLYIDVGKRLNVNTFQLYGREFGEYFEYNVAACLDVEWECNVFDENHTHIVTDSNGNSWTVIHKNKAYGLDSLGDCIITADSGREGTSYDATEGLATYGEHTYFYVNGDAEWLNATSSQDTKCEFGYRAHARLPFDYDNDPVALYLTIPQNKSVDLHKAVIYFKDAPNYRKMGISYYLGPNSIEDSLADVVGYKYIDNITSVALDGITYYPDTSADSDEWSISKFVTTNPLPDSRLSYVDGVAVNGDLYRFAGILYWNVFEYNFDPVNAYGFMLYSDWHKSTKIIEIELYSKFKIKPTLVDNVTIQTSTYGDTWETLVFRNDADDSNLISAFVPSSPRYFKLAIEPQDDFELYEMSLSLDDSSKGSVDCIESVVPTTAKNGALSSVQELEIENIYDIPLHLYVNIPIPLVNSTNLLAWLKLTSEETTKYGEVGPGAIVKKNYDYPLASYNNQVAINCPSYYLKNLIDGKQAYSYEYNKAWKSLGTLVANQEINSTNLPDSTLINLSFNKTASRYWKVWVGEQDTYYLNSYKLLNDGIEVAPSAVYGQVSVGESAAYRIPLSVDEYGILCDSIVLDYTFLTTNYLDSWVPSFDSGTYFSVNIDRGFYPTRLLSESVGTLSKRLSYDLNSFEVVIDFTFLPHSYFVNYSLLIDLQDVDGASLIYVTLVSDNVNITITAKSADPDAAYAWPGYYDDSYGSATITRAQAAEVLGKFKLLIKKTSRILNYIKITDVNDTNTYFNVTPSRTYFSSRLSNIAFTLGNVAQYNLPEELPTHRKVYSEVSAIVIDCLGNYGATQVGLRAVDIYDINGQLIDLVPGTNCTCYQSSLYSSYFSANYVFKSSTSKIGTTSATSWLSSLAGGSVGRIVCAFDSPITFSELFVTNYHSTGTGTNIGAKNIKIYVVGSYYTDPTYLAEIPDGTLIYSGVLKEHVAVDIADTEFLTTSGVSDMISDYEDPTKLNIGINSTLITAQPIISPFDNLLFEFTTVTPLTDIQLVTEGLAVDQTVVLISDGIDNTYDIWARNSSKFRITANTDAAFVSSGYVRLGYPYNGRSVQYPYLIMDRAQTTSYDTTWFGDIGQLPMWIAYDLGKGNECYIDAIRVLCFYEDVYAQELDGSAFGDIPPFPTVLHVYGSDDTSIDWTSKPKELLATVSGCVLDQQLFIELQTPRAYRYYCIYAPNLDSSIDEYTLGFQKLCMYTHFGSAKREYICTALSDFYGGGTYGLNYVTTDLYYDTYNVTTALTTDPYFTIDLKVKQYVSGIKMRINYDAYFTDYGHLEYSTDSTDGYDGTWLEISDFKDMVAYYTSTGTLLYYVITFDSPVYATWLRIRFLSASNAWATIYEIMPILGEMSSPLSVTSTTYSSYFVVDLGDVYSLDFVRNYGDSSYLLSLFDAELAISSERLEDVSEVSWESYTANTAADVRWLRIALVCGNAVQQLVQYLGIYPDTSIAYRKYGGYNCEWVSLGVSLTDYSYTLNVAPQAEFYYGNFDILKNVKTVILDIYDGYGLNRVGIAAVELYDADGSLIELSYGVAGVPDNYTPIDTSHDYTASADQAFNTSNTNIGYWHSSCWVSLEGTNTNVRIACILDSPVELSRIAIQNAHTYGDYTAFGAKTIAVWVSSEEITSNIIGDFSADALLVFSDDLPKHISLDVEDRYVIDLTNFTGATDNYFGDYTPNRCLQGDATLDGCSNSWGFSKGSHALYPTLVLKLDDVYNISTFKITHAPDDTATDMFTNTSYKIYGKLEEGSLYTELFYITDNDSVYREHVLDTALTLQYIKLEIISSEINGDYYYYEAGTNTPILIEDGFVREFEVWTDSGVSAVNSVEHPVVCINLKEAHNMTAHELVLLKEDPTNTLAWDNSEDFFKYSDDITDDPNKVSFISSSGETTLYSDSASYVEYTAFLNTLSLADAVYLPEGSYIIYWDSYNAASFDYVNIVFSGPATISCTAQTILAGWQSQTNHFGFATGGYYNISAKRGETGSLDAWGVRSITIVKTMSNTKWLSVKRDTATNHAWSDKSTDYGVDYLSRIKVFTETEYLPTEFPWFWSSVVSTVSREHINVKKGRYALKVEYPTSSGVDRLDFLEGDHFGWDENWSVKDTLSFWWYISDLDNLYIDEGGFGFGCFSGGDTVNFSDRYGNLVSIEPVPAYYLWDFKELDLKTGWNEVKLQFDRNTCTAPLKQSAGSFLEKELNFRENYFTSFGVVYKGYGRPFYMLFDDLRIERNFYNDIVNDDYGLCLTWKEYAEVPLAGITLYAGTVEFWVKLYTSTAGVDSFGDARSRVLFTLTNNYNELICLTLKSAGWLELGFGGARDNFNVIYLDPAEYNIENFSFGIDESFHVAVSWSSAGTSMDNSDTIRLYINNTLLISSKVTWEVSDTKSTILRLGGGSTILANNNDEEGSAIFNHLKVYDYCKTVFLLDTHLPEEASTIHDNAPIHISKDGVIFYNCSSSELPLKYEEVQPGEKVKVYTRIDKTDKLRSSDSGTLEIDWEVIV